MLEESDYEVGYGKPPKRNQFKKGKSGNPKGRPKGTKNFKTDFIEEMNEVIFITENGQRTPITKQRALIKRISACALSGDLKALSLMIDKMIALGVESDASARSLSQNDDKIIARYFERKKGD